MLSDTQIAHAVRFRGLEISGYNTKHLQPASYDVHLHPTLLVLKSGEALDPRYDSTAEWDIVRDIPEDGFVLEPGMFVLGSTLQRFTIGNELVGQLEGKSSLGRLGLMVHSTAGFLDPGFDGQVTLELSCVQSRGVKLFAAMPIAQVAFDNAAGVKKPYKGKYVNQSGPTSSRYHENWNGEAWV